MKYCIPFHTYILANIFDMLGKNDSEEEKWATAVVFGLSLPIYCCVLCCLHMTCWLLDCYNTFVILYIIMSMLSRLGGGGGSCSVHVSRPPNARITVKVQWCVVSARHQQQQHNNWRHNSLRTNDVVENGWSSGNVLTISKQWDTIEQ